jgi:hypothetical protein
VVSQEAVICLPDLIIQDELHLLAGPLGSAVALFESAVDQLCCREDGTRPKVISSTATTRNTDLQIMALFDRRVNLFPKPGIESDDSFFAFYKRSFPKADSSNVNFISKRRYMGVLPTGRTQIWMQMRVASVLLTHRALYEMTMLRDKQTIDNNAYSKGLSEAINYYHTIISYFNSLKEVGKTESQIHTYLIKEIRRVFNRVIRPGKLMHSLYTYAIKKGELTGRLSGDEVKDQLSLVSSRWEASSRFATQNNGEISSGWVPPDFIVATNMISVGIDVSRFNQIIMNSMPRNIAEYIQASSRVARDSLGLVITVHHPFRARDLSHYEKFIEFHEKMYSYVEPISITPFTSQALNRYLGLYFATMVRHTTIFVERDSAENISNLSDAEINNLIDNICVYFENRRLRLASYDVSELVKNLLQESNVDEARAWIRGAFEDWQRYSNDVLLASRSLVFTDKAPKSKIQQEQLYVDIDEYDSNMHSSRWKIPMSLRVIEPGAAIKIKSK